MDVHTLICVYVSATIRVCDTHASEYFGLCAVLVLL